MTHFHTRFMIAAALLCSVVLPSIASAQSAPRPTQDELTKTRAGGQDWVTYGGSLNNQRYSTLDQINTSNVESLKGAWLTRLGSGRGAKYYFEADPLVIDGVMYIPTGNDDIFALDAQDRAQDLGVRLGYSPDQRPDLLRLGQPRRRRRRRQDLLGPARRQLRRPRPEDWADRLAHAARGLPRRLQHHRRHPLLRRHRLHGHVRRRERRPRSRVRPRRQDRAGAVALLHHPTGASRRRHLAVANDPTPQSATTTPTVAAPSGRRRAIDPELGMVYFSTGNAGPDYDGSRAPWRQPLLRLDRRAGLQDGRSTSGTSRKSTTTSGTSTPPARPCCSTRCTTARCARGIYQAVRPAGCYFLDRTNGNPLIGIDEKAVPQEPRMATAATQPIPVGDSVHRHVPRAAAAVPALGLHLSPRSGTSPFCCATARWRWHRVEPDLVQPADRLRVRQCAPAGQRRWRRRFQVFEEGTPLHQQRATCPPPARPS